MGGVVRGVTRFASMRGQLVDQGIDAGAGGGQARPQRITLLCGHSQLLLQQGIGTPQFFMAQQQAFDAVREFVDSGHGRDHPPGSVGPGGTTAKQTL